MNKWKRKICKGSVLLASLFVLIQTTIAQPYGNEWIQYSQKYYKFPIVQNGIYRINHATLSAALGVIPNPKSLRIFARGKEIPLHFEGQDVNTFNTNDYIEFYGEKNDGWLDSVLYGSLKEQTNPYYSLFSDTAYYFLTYGTSLNGLRFQEDTLTNFPSTPLPYFIKEDVLFYPEEYNFGQPTGAGYSPFYTIGEGWMSVPFSFGAPKIVSFNTENAYVSSGLNAQVDTRIAFVNDNLRRFQLKYGTSGIIVLDTIDSSYAVIDHSFQIPTNQLFNTLPLTYELASGYSGTQYTSVPYVSIKFPHTNRLEGQNAYTFGIPYTSLSATHFKVYNFSTQSAHYLYDLTDNRRIRTVQTADTVQALIPVSNTGEEKKCFLTTTNQIQFVTNIVPVANNGLFTNYTAVNKDSAFLIVTHPSLWTSAIAYKSYRESTGYQVELANIEELYDQFSYGVKKHPLSIRNFTRYAWDQWPSKPSQLFLIGKSIMEANQLFRKDPFVFEANLVPTHGYPVSDNALTVAIDGILNTPTLQVGRLSATNNEQVNQYLQKVIEFESTLNTPNMSQNISDKLWQKNVVHFGGGSESEQPTFKYYLNTYKDTISSTNFGAKVYSFFKSTADPFGFNLIDSIKNLINNGTMMLSFFGHASANSFDINIDDPSTYDNNGKYFFLLSNGCLSGDMFQNNTSSNMEEFILIPQKAAIAFIAQTNYAYHQDLNDYSKELYRNISNRYYNQSIGKIMREAARISIQNQGGSFSSYYTAFQMHLHGDPALKLSENEEPDYAVVEPPQLYFSPAEISSDLDSFEVHIKVSNIGKAVDSIVFVSLKRILPDGVTDTTYIFALDSMYYQEEISFKLPVLGAEGAGINTFEVRVDQNQLITEQSELNNTILAKELTISSRDATPIYPYNYAVVGNASLTLSASTNDVFASQQTYLIQIDTTDLYNSPVLKDTLITQEGGVLSWDITLPVTQDSTVYFWRVSPNASNSQDFKWKEHSFQYILSQYGWAQDHFFQFKKNAFTQLNYLKDQYKLTYDTSGASITCQTKGSPTDEELFGVKYEWNGILMIQNKCGASPYFFVAVFDPQTLRPWYNAHVLNGDTFNFPENDFGNSNNMLDPDPGNCLFDQSGGQAVFSFRADDAEQMDSLASFLTNKVPNGHYILTYSAGLLPFASSTILNNSQVKQAYQNLGSQDIQTLPDFYPWIFFVKKGDINSAEEVPGTSTTDDLSLSTGMKGAGNYGEITSPLIGPANSWGTLHWNYTKQEDAQDTVRIQVLGAGDQVLGSFNNWNGNNISLGTMISAQQYPYIKLRAKLTDKTHRTPSFSDSWHIIYDEAPESALDYHSGFVFFDDTLTKGDLFTWSIPIQNVSRKDLDSLRINYVYTNSSAQSFGNGIQKKSPLLSGQMLKDTLRFSTSNLKHGPYTLRMEVNPKDSLWQIEQYHFNNVATKRFYIQGDVENPLLDVTFDGARILDGDIVAPSPEISISLKDENKYLFLNEDKDTANFKIYLLDPEGNSQRIGFVSNASYSVDYQKSSRPTEPFSIQIKPNALADGIYTLRVQAQDKSGNLSDDVEYSISFEIINKSTITNVMNYPNPFSTATRFVFTLTGSQIPDVFKIQILTVSGKLVREITKDELGDIRIGRNISQYVWDGTDEYGDRLANGVYLYRVITKMNDQAIELRSTQADQYFHKGFGKMYLMR